MAKFNAYVSLYDGGGQRHGFKPGDTVPDWAEDKVSKGVLGGSETEETPAPFRKPSIDPEGDNPKLTPAAVGDLGGPEDEGDDDVEDEDDSPSQTEGTPDFTKPAPRTRAAKK